MISREELADSVIRMVRNGATNKELLKFIEEEYQAHAMTLVEILDDGYRPLYLETRDGELQMYCTLHHFDDKTMTMFIDLAGFESPCGFKIDVYNKEWRIWTCEPTKDQMIAEPWKQEWEE